MGEEEPASREELRELAIYLEGVKTGRGGSILPLGTIHIDNLWKVIRHLDNMDYFPKHFLEGDKDSKL